MHYLKRRCSHNLEFASDYSKVPIWKVELELIFCMGVSSTLLFPIQSFYHFSPSKQVGGISPLLYTELASIVTFNKPLLIFQLSIQTNRIQEVSLCKELNSYRI